VHSFGFYYFQDALRIESPARMVGDLMMIVGVSITLVAYPAGMLSERWGRKPLSLVACAMAGVGMAMLTISRDAGMLMFLGGLIGVGMGIFASVNWAWATDLVPPAEAGKYLGLSNLATAGSAAASRLLGPAIDLINAHLPYAGYSTLFGLATVAALMGLLVTIRIRETRPPT
jgi:MFS family permease